MSGIIAQNVGRHGGLIKAPSGGGGAWTLISTVTSDGSDDSLSFTSGIDSTYDEYCFIFNNIHPETDNVEFTFNGSIDGGSNYNVTKTTTYFYAGNFEGAGTATLAYETTRDLAESTAFTELAGLIGNAADESASGYLYLFAPSDTTFVKHFISESSTLRYNERLQVIYTAGYANTTSAVDAIQFKMSADEIQGGSISMYGIS